MTLFQERLRTTKDFITDRGADNTTAGTLSDVSTTDTSFLRFTLATVINSLAGGVTGKHLTIVNANSVGISIVNDSGGTEANRILTGTGANITLAVGASIDLVYDDGAFRWRVVGSVSGTGDVTGPASATDGRVALFDGATGKLLKNGTKLESDLVTGPSSVPNTSRVAVFDGATGKLLKVAAFNETDVVFNAAQLSVVNEILLFANTTGTNVKSATGTGYLKAVSGVYQTPSATIPSADILGRTDGSNAASGRIGEPQISNLPSDLALAGASGASQLIHSWTIPAGIWLVTGLSYFSRGATWTYATNASWGVSLNTANAYDIQFATVGQQILGASNGNVLYQASTPWRIVPSSGSQIVYMVGYITYAGGGDGGFYESTGGRTHIRAVRIG